MLVYIDIYIGSPLPRSRQYQCYQVIFNNNPFRGEEACCYIFANLYQGLSAIKVIHLRRSIYIESSYALWR